MVEVGRGAGLAADAAQAIQPVVQVGTLAFIHVQHKMPGLDQASTKLKLSLTNTGKEARVRAIKLDKNVLWASLKTSCNIRPNMI